MGFFNRNKKKEIQTPINREYKQQSNIEYNLTKDGKLQIDYYDAGSKVGKMYDTTRLIIDNVATKLNNRTISKGLVSWYGRDDAVMLNRGNGEEIGRRTDYSEILADIDFNLIQTDRQYCEMVMKSLLRQNRVMEYLERGLQDNPRNPCGMYIGGVRKIGNGYEKFFDCIAGKEAHNRPEMVEKRYRYKNVMERRRQERIARNNAEIRKLQEENDELSR